MEEKEQPEMSHRHEHIPRMIRVYYCVFCKKTGGTLKNIGTREKPAYAHPHPCLAEREGLKKLRALSRSGVKP